MTLALTLLIAFPLVSSAQGVPAARGRDLFTGSTRLANGGPACISCHSIAGLGFPGGGTLGPDLTHSYRKLGPQGTHAAMETLFFSVMTPIYGPRPLAPEEQADLMAFLQQAESQPETLGGTQIILGGALLIGAVFTALTGFLWRDRVQSVRRALLAKAARQGARP